MICRIFEKNGFCRTIEVPQDRKREFIANHKRTSPNLPLFIDGICEHQGFYSKVDVIVQESNLRSDKT